MRKFKVGDKVTVIKNQISQWMYDGLGAQPWDLIIKSPDGGHSTRDYMYVVEDRNTGRSTYMYEHRLEFTVRKDLLPKELFEI